MIRNLNEQPITKDEIKTLLRSMTDKIQDEDSVDKFIMKKLTDWMDEEMYFLSYINRDPNKVKVPEPIKYVILRKVDKNEIS